MRRKDASAGPDLNLTKIPEKMKCRNSRGRVLYRDRESEYTESRIGFALKIALVGDHQHRA